MTHQLTVDVASALPGPAWLRAERTAAAERFAAADLPTSALEDWRYSRIDALDLERFTPATYPGDAAAPSDPAHDPVRLLLSDLGEDAVVVETVDGRVSSVGTSQRPVVVRRVAEAGGEDGGVPARPDFEDPDPFAIANRAFAPDPLLIEIGRAAALAGRAPVVVVVHRCQQDHAVVFPRLHIRVADGGAADILEVVAGSAASLVVPVTEIEVGGGAHLTHTSIQVLGGQAWQIAHQGSRVSADADFVSAAVALGGDYARIRTESALVGTGASSRLVAGYFGGDQQMHDFRTVQDHRSPRSTSNLLYKGVVANTARSVYTGLIRVEKGARGTNAFQTNRNLVLHEGAHADSVPNLEIEDNDVRCSHASAVGPIAEEERFYLESRGVPSEVTERLIAVGFLGEVVEELPIAALRPWVGLAVAQKLADAEKVQRGRA